MSVFSFGSLVLPFVSSVLYGPSFGARDPLSKTRLVVFISMLIASYTFTSFLSKLNIRNISTQICFLRSNRVLALG